MRFLDNLLGRGKEQEKGREGRYTASPLTAGSLNEALTEVGLLLTVLSGHMELLASCPGLTRRSPGQEGARTEQVLDLYRAQAADPELSIRELRALAQMGEGFEQINQQFDSAFRVARGDMVTADYKTADEITVQDKRNGQQALYALQNWLVDVPATVPPSLEKVILTSFADKGGDGEAPSFRAADYFVNIKSVGGEDILSPREVAYALVSVAQAFVDKMPGRGDFGR